MKDRNLLGRLRKAVKKVRTILDVNVNPWLFAFLFGVSASASRRRINFDVRSSGLLALTDDASSQSSETPIGLHRTSSYLSEDDVDKRAELFIENFRKQLLLERQISLDLRYVKGN